VVAGGIAGHVEFLAQLMSTPAGAAIDVANAHAYPETWSPQPLELLPRYIQQIADVLGHGGRAAHRAPSLWIAEVGYSDFRNAARVSHDVIARFAYEHTRSFQAVAQLRILALLLASPEVDLVAWYEVKYPPPGAPMIGDDNNRHLGVATWDYRPKPSLSSLRLFVERTKAGIAVLPVAVRVSSGGQVPIVARAFETPDGDVTLFAWIPTREPGIAVPIDARGDEADPRHARVNLEIPIATAGEASLLDPTGASLGSPAVEHGSDRTTVQGIELSGGMIGIVALHAVHASISWKQERSPVHMRRLPD
jgi:hypothetical protein